jgi:hypothetical protein
MNIFPVCKFNVYIYDLLINFKGWTFNKQQLRKYSDHAHGGDETPSKFAGPYRKPVIPPNRPLAFLLGGVLFFQGLWLVTGGFMSAPEDEYKHPHDRKREIYNGLPATSWGKAFEDKHYDDGYGKAKFETRS